ncbi:MAG: glycosyltransferase family 4 protein, partial [Chthoniobacterales bacterium]
ALVARHEQRYGTAGKAALRARNALYFAELFERHGVGHFHVHFANRAAQTALFVKAISGIPFSVTAHGQDFMVDLGSIELLREICAEAEFVAAETDYSVGMLRERCPDAAGKIHRVYNGMDLANFPAPALRESRPNEPGLILSVGRLVEFKGFRYLIDACAELQRRGCDFRCEIVGDGPLREALERQITEAQLGDRVVLSGARSQEEIFQRLREADIFALPSIVDGAGASDIFPTVILEAMASARPVVSTTVAGIPESVVDGATGFLVSPNDSEALANALENLLRDADLRGRLGAAGRVRVEQHFQVETTVEPLEALLRPLSLGKNRPAESILATGRIAYLIDCWPDQALPDLETELAEMRQREIEIVPFVCRLSDQPLPAGDFARQLRFLPDAIVLEAEWQQERALARTLEAEHAAALQRVPGALFLEQARFALALRKLLKLESISHLHATSSRALVGALLLRRVFVARASSLPDPEAACCKLAPLTLTAAIEAHPTLPRNALKDALAQIEGGRVFDPRLVRQAPGSFLTEAAPSLLSRVRLDRRGKFWQDWAERLARWSAPQIS